MLRRKIISMLTVLAVTLSVMAPTLALAAPNPGHRRPAQVHQRMPQKHSVQKRPFRSMADSERRVRPRLERERDRVVNPHRYELRRSPHRDNRHSSHRYERREHRYNHHRRPRFSHRGRWYNHGYYRCYRHGHWRTMHSDDWIRLIGVSAFVALIANNHAHYYDPDNVTVIYDRYGNVVAIYEN